MAQNITLISYDYLKANTNIEENIDVKTLTPYIILSQEKYLLPILGTALYNKICTDAIAGTLTGDYQSLLETYGQPTLAWYCLYEMLPWVNFQLTNKAVSLKNSDTSQPATKEDIQYLQAKLANNAEYYAQRMINYLRANYTLFPELLNQGADVSTVFPILSDYFGGLHIARFGYNDRFIRSQNGNYDGFYGPYNNGY